nr:MAG TPA: hypothetical protein [Caudoviricetes sp.]DAM41184.1 MAG TPA: hypothetical protein [Caudoviricetes sp.]
MCILKIGVTGVRNYPLSPINTRFLTEHLNAHLSFFG